MRPVDFGNLGSEELGSVYESLLELHPRIDTDEGPFTLAVAAGHERKSTGSYYTPTSLITCLLDSALEPVVHEALAKPNAEEALLSLKICDPACGSGHFLIAVAERLAKHLARLRTGDDEPSIAAIQQAKRAIIGRCIHGVDLNPMAAELCKVSLWIETLDPGKPLSFLDHHILVGNSLLGASPALLWRGIPDEAFEPIEGDGKSVCKEYRKRNRDERRGQGTLFERFEARPGSDWGTSPRPCFSSILWLTILSKASGPRKLDTSRWWSRAATSPAAYGPTPGVQRSSGRRCGPASLSRSSSRSPRRPFGRSRKTRTRFGLHPKGGPPPRRSVPVLPLAPGVPRRLPAGRDDRRRHDTRLVWRLRRCAWKPAVGTHQDPGARVVRTTTSRLQQGNQCLVPSQDDPEARGG